MISQMAERRGKTFTPPTTWQERREFQSAIERLWQTVGCTHSWRPYTVLGRQRWTPPIDFCRLEDSILISAELPGLTSDDVEVTVSQNTLTLRGEKSPNQQAGEEGCFCAERPYGRFTRSMALPPGADPNRAQATFKRGVLEIKIPLKSAPAAAAPKMLLHACPNCRGDLFLDEEEGQEFVCLQCSRRTSLQALETIGGQAANGRPAA